MISIIVPIYKIEQYLRQCVDSLLSQTYSELEIILVDDGSPDGCPAICDEYATLDNRIKVVHKANCGLMSARQAGLKSSTGEYIGFVDGDDWVEPNMYKCFADSIEKYHPDMVYCEFYYAYKDHNEKSNQISDREIYYKQQLEEEIYPLMLFKEPYYSFGINPCCWSKVFKKDLLEKVLYPVTQRIKIGEDAAFTYPALLAADSVAYVNQYLYHYRINPEAMTKKYDASCESTILIPFGILKDTFSLYPYDLSEQLSYYLLMLLNTMVRNESSTECPKNRKEKIATFKHFTNNNEISKSLKSIDTGILPLHTKLLTKLLKSRCDTLIYWYTVLLRRFL